MDACTSIPSDSADGRSFEVDSELAPVLGGKLPAGGRMLWESGTILSALWSKLSAGGEDWSLGLFGGTDRSWCAALVAGVLIWEFGCGDEWDGVWLSKAA